MYADGTELVLVTSKNSEEELEINIYLSTSIAVHCAQRYGL